MVLWRTAGNHAAKEFTAIVAPGVDFPNSDFLDELGKPIQFAIVFRYGKTDDLPSNIARYLIDKGLAQETRFILNAAN